MANLNLVLDVYESFLEEEIDLEKFLKKVFTWEHSAMDEMDAGSEGEIKSQLLSYRSNEGGSPQYDGFILADEEYYEERKSGKVSINYNIAYYFSCSDIDNDDDHYQTVTFDVDVDNEVVIVHFLDYEKRTTYEEF